MTTLWEGAITHICIERPSREVARAKKEGGFRLLLAVRLHSFKLLPLSTPTPRRLVDCVLTKKL